MSEMDVMLLCLFIAVPDTDVEDLSRGDITRDQITVLRIPLFQEIESFRVGDGGWVSRISQPFT